MLSVVTPFKGELAALGAALIWAIASFFYLKLGKRMSPLVLNGVKSAIAIAMILITLVLIPQSQEGLNFRTLGLLGLSGALGIGLGDTAFFATLNNLGARRALLMDSLAPPMAALLAWGTLGEALGATAWLGILLTVGGVAWVVVEQEPSAIAPHNLQLQRDRLVRGVAYGLVAALCQAGGAVLSRAALADTEVSPLWSTLIRLAAGLLVLLLWLVRQPDSVQELRWVRSPRFLGVVVGTAFAGTFLGIWLQQTALKFTATGIAQSLTATSPLFVLPIAWMVGERVSLRSVVGVLVALAGIWLLFAQSG